MSKNNNNNIDKSIDELARFLQFLDITIGDCERSVTTLEKELERLGKKFNYFKNEIEGIKKSIKVLRFEFDLAKP